MCWASVLFNVLLSFSRFIYFNRISNLKREWMWTTRKLGAFTCSTSTMCQAVFKLLRILHERKQIKPCSCGICTLIFSGSYTAAIVQEDDKAACLLLDVKLLGEWKSDQKRDFWACGTVVKNLPASAGNTRDVGSTPGLGRSPGGGHGNPLQDCCLENPHGQRSLGYRPWGHKEVDMTETTYHTHRRVRANTREASRPRDIRILFHYNNNFLLKKNYLAASSLSFGGQA